MIINSLSNEERLLFNKNKYEGSVFQTNGGQCTIIQYNKATDVVVEFEDGYRKSFQLSKIVRGTIRNPNHENFKVYGVGILDLPIKGNEYKYNVWSNMLYRTTNKVDGCYKDSCVSDNWLIFSKFVNDYNEMIGSDRSEELSLHLDKDILIKGNKKYSKETCCLVPREINNLLIHKSDCSDKNKLGVSFKKSAGKYVSQISIFGDRKFLGYFDCEDDAFFAYKKAKESYVKVVTEKFKHLLDERVYEILMSWELCDD